MVVIPQTSKDRFTISIKQGGLELPAEFYFKTSNETLFNQMKEKTLVEIEKFEKERKQKEEEKKKKKKPEK